MLNTLCETPSSDFIQGKKQTTNYDELKQYYDSLESDAASAFIAHRRSKQQKEKKRELHREKRSFLDSVVQLIREMDGVARKKFKKKGAPVVVMGKPEFSMTARGSKASLALQLYEHLCKKFAVISLNEYNTSKLCALCHEELIQSSIWKQKHCSKASCPNAHKDVIDRDQNATLNMFHIFIHLLRTGQRPHKFRPSAVEEPD